MKPAAAPMIFSPRNSGEQEVRWFLVILLSGLLYPFSAFSASDDTLRRALASATERDRAAILNSAAARIVDDDPEGAAQLAQEALQLAEKWKLPQEEARACFLIAESEVVSAQVAASIPWYKRSAEIEKQIGGESSSNYADRIGDIGYALYTINKHAEALVYLEKSLDLALQGGFYRQAASMYSNIGSIYIEWGDYGKGLENNQRALELDLKGEEPEVVSIDLNNIGKIYEQTGRYDQAVKYYREALVMAQQSGNQSMVAVRLNNLGIVHKAWKKYGEALTFFREALAIDQKEGNLAKVGKRLSYIGATYLEMGDHEQCIRHLKLALPYVLDSQLNDEMARLDNLFGKYYLASGEYEKAIKAFSDSQRGAEKSNLKPLQIGNLSGLSEAFERTGRAADALLSVRKMMVLKDSVYSEESTRKLAEFEARFENEKMRLENDLLKKDARLRSNMYLISGILALSVVIILASLVFIFRLRHRNALQAKELAEKDAEQVRDDLETRNRELALQAMKIIKNNETIASVIEGMDKNHRNGEGDEGLEAGLNRILSLDKDKGWKEFEVHFTRVHTDFYTKLNDRFPDLTPNERKLCAFLRMNMTTKDIASITHQSVHSINVARTRLRRKLNLANSDDNLVSFLMNL